MKYKGNNKFNIREFIGIKSCRKTVKIPMNNIELYDYWIDSSNEDYETMKILYNAQKYTWSLFLGHLVIEKILKGIYARENIENPIAPKIHNLILLAEKSKISIPNEIYNKIKVINTFNISARYDNYKNYFYNKCSLEYTKGQIENIEEVRKWLKEL